MAAILLLLALLARDHGEGVLLAILAILAMVGVFCLFAMAAGLIRFAERANDHTIAAGVAGNLSEAIHVTTKDGATLYANEAYRALVGQGSAGQMGELEGAFAGIPVAGEALFRLARAAERGEQGEEIFKVPAPRPGNCQSVSPNMIEAPTGDAGAYLSDTKWYKIAVSPSHQAEHTGGEDLSVIWKIADISDVQTAAAQSALNFEQELQVFEDLPVGLLTIGADGRVEKMNRTLSQWLALDEAAGPDQYGTLADLIRDHDEGLMQLLTQGHELHQQSRTGEDQSCSIDVEFISAQSQIIPMRLLAKIPDRSAGSQDSANRSAMTLVVQKRCDVADDAEQSGTGDIGLARFFEKAPFGIATVDASGRIKSNNAPFARMFGARRVTRNTTITKLLGRGAGAKARQRLLKALDEIADGHGTVEPVDVTLAGKGDQTRRIFVTPFRRQSDANEAAILYVVDTTEQKALELQFAQSQKMEAVGKLAGGIAHDFNNVLTVIIGLSDLFLQTRRPTDAGYNDIMQIKTNAKRVAGTVRHLLAFSRKQTLSAEVMMLNDVVQDLGFTLNRLLGERVELKVHCQRDLWYVKADHSKFEQVVINLAVNARDAMPDGGRLSIRTKNITERDSLKLTDQGVVRGEYVLIEVKDTGTGMSKDVVEKIFEPFYTTKGVGKGTGLGLASVYGFVKQTGGYVYADSKLGKGSAFRVYLPRHQGEVISQELAAAKNDAAEPPRDLTGTGRVLLVEDEDGVRSFATRALKRQGYEVLEASSGVEALEVLKKFEGTVDLVVSDVVMPEMDGPTLLKELRKTNKDLKFVFMSGYPDDAFAKTLDENESYGFLAKPFTLPQLAAKVKEEMTG